jgi:DNA-binding NarL/FixJ family response regulator
MPPRLRVLIAHPNETVLAALGSLVECCEQAELVGLAASSERLEELASQTTPDVIVTGLPVWRAEVSEAVHRLKRGLPDSYLIATSDDTDGPYHTLARAAGVDEVLGNLEFGERLRGLLEARV